MTGVYVFVFSVNNNGTIIDWTNDADQCNVQYRTWGHVADYASGCFSKAVQNGWKIED